MEEEEEEEEEELLNRYYTFGHYNEFPVYLSEKFNVNTVGLGTDSLHESLVKPGCFFHF